MKKNSYKKPNLEIVTFFVDDVITKSSGGGLTDEGDQTIGNGPINGEPVMPDPVAVMN